MARWEPDAFRRLHVAAVELFQEQGFERTTVAEIARRAGLTERTFFNHFADKREVLFDLAQELQDEIVRDIADADGAVAPLDAVVHALQAAADSLLEPRRDAVLRRNEIIAANAELQEREASKQVVLATAMADALQGRGVDFEPAFIAANAGLLVASVAAQRWARPAERQSLRDLMAEALGSVRVTVDTTGRHDAAPSA